MAKLEPENSDDVFFTRPHHKVCYQSVCGVVGLIRMQWASDKEDGRMTR